MGLKYEDVFLSPEFTIRRLRTGHRYGWFNEKLRLVKRGNKGSAEQGRGCEE